MYYQLKAFSTLVPLVTSSVQILVSQQLKNDLSLFIKELSCHALSQGWSTFLGG